MGQGAARPLLACGATGQAAAQYVHTPRVAPSQIKADNSRENKQCAPKVEEHQNSCLWSGRNNFMNRCAAMPDSRNSFNTIMLGTVYFLRTVLGVGSTTLLTVIILKRTDLVFSYYD
jgi:hypothetical protein